jgi:hypothetical protein
MLKIRKLVPNIDGIIEPVQFGYIAAMGIAEAFKIVDGEPKKGYIGDVVPSNSHYKDKNTFWKSEMFDTKEEALAWVQAKYESLVMQHLIEG